MEKEGRLSGSGFRVQGSRLARRTARPLIMDESFARIRNAKLEMRNGGAAPPQIYILQRSCHHNPEPINLNPEPNLCFQTSGLAPWACWPLIACESFA